MRAWLDFCEEHPNCRSFEDISMARFGVGFFYVTADQRAVIVRESLNHMENGNASESEVTWTLTEVSETELSEAPPSDAELSDAELSETAGSEGPSRA